MVIKVTFDNNEGCNFNCFKLYGGKFKITTKRIVVKISENKKVARIFFKKAAFNPLPNTVKKYSFQLIYQ